MSRLSWVLIAMTGLFLGACGEGSKQGSASNNEGEKRAAIEWKLVTSWPNNFPGLGMEPERFSKLVAEMSDGRLKIKVYGAGELMPAFEVFDAVSQGSVQMGGWFNKEIESMEDLKGLKMRLSGLGGEAIKRVGGVPVTLPGRELYTALQTGAIDATEWVGPFNDQAFGLHKTAKFYYYPGWHEPGSTLEFLINKEAFAALPADLQAIVRVAARAINQDMLDEYTSKHVIAQESLINEHNLIIKQFPDEVMKQLARGSKLVIKEQSEQDDTMKKVYDAYMAYQVGVRKYHLISEDAYSRLRH